MVGLPDVVGQAAEKMMKGVNIRFSATDQTGSAARSVQKNLSNVNRQLQASGPLQRSWNAGLNSNRRAVQQLGFQVTDFATQIAGGQSAMLAFTQQGGQMLQFFGPFGAIAAALLAVFGSLAIAFTKSGHAISELYPLMGVLRQELSMLATGLGIVKELLIDFTNLILNNLDVIIIAVGIVVGWMAGKWVAAWAIAAVTTGAFANVLRATVVSFYAAGAGAAAATLATSAWTGALALLRVALVRLGIPALIIGTAWLIERFYALVQAAGGVGNALALLGEVAKEVFDRIRITASLTAEVVGDSWIPIYTGFVRVLADMISAWAQFLRILSSGVSTIPFMGDTALALNNAAIGAQSLNYQLKGVADNAADAYGELTGSAARSIADVWSAPIPALEKIRELVKETKIDIRDWAGKGTPDEGGGGGGGKSAAATAKEQAAEIVKTFEDMQKAISDSMLGSFKALLNGTKSLGEAARDILGTIIDKVIDLLMTPVFNNIAGNIAGGLLGGLGRIGAVAPGIPSFAGGGSTWSGPRAGGMDGQGGRLAVLHPNETVTDHTLGGGNGMTINFTVNAKDADSFRASRRQIERDLASAVRSGQR